MKKIVIIILIMGIASQFSCKDVLETKFNKPNAITDASFGALFTGLLQTWGLYIPVYGDEYHNLRNMNRLLGLGYFVGSYSSGPNSYADNQLKMYTGWSGGNLRNALYTRMLVDAGKNLPVMNLKLANMRPEDQKSFEIYMHCTHITKAAMFQRLTDVYDDVPYSEAGGAYEGKYWPKYDKQKDIYYGILDNLKSVAERLHGYALNNSLAHINFKQADILLGGDILKWEKLCNSLRLRMAMRLSTIEPAKSKEVIGEIISKNLPTVSEADDFVGIEWKNKATIFELSSFRSFKEVFFNQYAPYFVVNDVFGYKGETSAPGSYDPRLHVIFQPNKYGKYLALKPWGPEQEAQLLQDYPADPDKKTVQTYDFDENNNAYYSMYNKMTYFNFDMKFPVFTPSETHLILAEAAVRFPEIAGGVAPDAEYKKAISLSIDWYYSINNSNRYSGSSTPLIPGKIYDRSMYAKPDGSIINAFLANKTTYFSGLGKDDKIKEIFGQKFAHLNILGQYEIWADARRLRKEYGLLVPRSTKVEWIERFQYPESEPSINPDSFKSVMSKNDYSTPVWWTGRTQ